MLDLNLELCKLTTATVYHCVNCHLAIQQGTQEKRKEEKGRAEDEKNQILKSLFSPEQDAFVVSPMFPLNL